MRKISKVLSLFLLIITIFNITAYAEININQDISAALLGDVETGEILYSYNINEQRAIASISKLMTYLVMMDAASEGKISLDDDVVISGHAAATEGSRFGLISGETIKLSMLAKGMLVVSGNDCATAIAEHLGKTEDNFVKMMNEKAAELGLLSASFINPHGLPIDDRETGQNHMSASDLYKLTRHILTKYPEVLEITALKELVIPERNYKKTATNPALGIVEGVDGFKTGYTDKAGICLISTMPVTGSGQDFRLVGIILGAKTHDDRINKTKELLEYGKNNYSYKLLADKAQKVDEVYIGNSKSGNVSIYPFADYNKIVKNDDSIWTKVVYSDSVKAPLKQGDKVGTISIFVNDEEIGQVDAVVSEDIGKANIFVIMLRLIKNIFS